MPGAEQQAARGLGEVVDGERPASEPVDEVGVAVAVEVAGRRRGAIADVLAVERIRGAGEPARTTGSSRCRVLEVVEARPSAARDEVEIAVAIEVGERGRE